MDNSTTTNTVNLPSPYQMVQTRYLRMINFFENFCLLLEKLLCFSNEEINGSFGNCSRNQGNVAHPTAQKERDSRLMKKNVGLDANLVATRVKCHVCKDKNKFQNK